jgi:hypothetical protein
VDSSPVAAALSRAKLANADPSHIVRAADDILRQVQPKHIPTGEFWDLAYEQAVLRQLCSLRESLLVDCCSDVQKALRAIVMGALHGPRPKGRASYFSNQAPRTYAPKPRYAVGYWKREGLFPETVDVLAIIEERATRYYGEEITRGRGRIAQADSRYLSTYARLLRGHQPRWVITSPPYYGMRMYRPDQWLRGWFVGGTAEVDYSATDQLTHASPRIFASQLRRAWRLSAEVCAQDAQMVVRFGGIRDRKAEPLAIVHGSFSESGWRIRSIHSAGSAAHGKRQALHFTRSKAAPLEEYDVWAVRI